MLGRDDIAAELWRLAHERGLQAAAAEAAIGRLFRTRQVPQFLAAWRALPDPDHLATDMLWHLLTPRLGFGTDRETLLLLASAVRTDQSHADLERLAPHLTAALGQAHTRRIIEREMNRADTPQLRRQLERLLRAQ